MCDTVAHMTLIYVQYEWRRHHPIRLYRPQSSQWFHRVVTITYWHVWFARFWMNFIFLRKVCICLCNYHHEVIHPFKRYPRCRAFLHFYLVVFCTNTIFVLFRSPQLLITLDNQDLSVMCFARAFHHNTLGYSPPVMKHSLRLLLFSSFQRWCSTFMCL